MKQDSIITGIVITLAILVVASLVYPLFDGNPAPTPEELEVALSEERLK